MHADRPTICKTKGTGIAYVRRGVMRVTCMLWAYINRFLLCAFRPQLTWADLIAFVVGFFIPMMVWFVSEVPDDFRMSMIRDQFLVGLIVVLLLRFICAPYLIWRELIAYVSELHRELDEKMR